MPMFSVYIIPRENEPLYQVGSAFLGHDVRRGVLSEPLLSDRFDPGELESWLHKARSFGFHATLGDALEYDEESRAEIKARLNWIADRIPAFTLINGRFHDTYKKVPTTLAATFDSPDGMLQKLHYLIVTMVNVLYRSSPYFAIESYSKDQWEHIIRYGVPHRRLLDQFDLHFAFASTIPDQQIWDRLRAEIIRETGLFSVPEHRVLRVDEIHMLERRSDGYFRIIETFALTGEGGS